MTLFAPNRAPDFVELKLSAYRTEAGAVWWETRPIITPRLQLVHTNGASQEGSIESSINWGNAAPYANTHPHYQVDRDRAAKLVPTNRKAIGNKTTVEARGAHGDAADWSLVIETADEGYPTPGESGGFIGEQVEMIAEILAYESIVHRIPLVYPANWWDPGTACHTEPFGYPFWTNANGKVCPGRTKKQQMRDVVLPLARQILDQWTNPPEEPVAVQYFKTDAAELTVWATADGLTAWRLDEYVANARGVDLFNVPVMPPSEAAKLMFQNGGLPNLSVR